MMLPVTDLKTALHWGLGRALQQLASSDITSQMQETVLDACLTCYSFDPQCTGPVTRYLLEAARLAGVQPQLEPLLSQSIDTLSEDDYNHWDMV